MPDSEHDREREREDFAEQSRFLNLKKQAEEKTLLVSPPYADAAAQTAFLSGYETALRDIAKGWLRP